MKLYQLVNESGQRLTTLNGLSYFNTKLSGISSWSLFHRLPKPMQAEAAELLGLSTEHHISIDGVDADAFPYINEQRVWRWEETQASLEEDETFLLNRAMIRCIDDDIVFAIRKRLHKQSGMWEERFYEHLLVSRGRQ